jgi:hypothetical protein
VRPNGPECTVLWLISNLQLYLKGFLKRRIRPKARKNSQKCTCGTHEAGAFTMPLLTMLCAYAGFTVRSCLGCAGYETALLPKALE